MGNHFRFDKNKKSGFEPLADHHGFDQLPDEGSWLSKLTRTYQPPFPKEKKLGGNDILEDAGRYDTMFGGAGNDTLRGGDDRDTLVGEDGNHTLRGGFGVESLSGGADNDSLNGCTGNESLCGDNGADFLCGSSGNDLLEGGIGEGTGQDTQTGGTCADELQFRLWIDTDSRRESDFTAPDWATDFSRAEGDKINLLNSVFRPFVFRGELPGTFTKTIGKGEAECPSSYEV